MSRLPQNPRIRRRPLVILSLLSALVPGLTEGVLQGTIALVLEDVFKLSVTPTQLDILVALSALGLVGAIAGFALSIDAIARWLWQVLNPHTATNPPPTIKVLKDPFQGLIVFVGKPYGSKPTSAELAIARHLKLVDPPHLNHCWLICTSQTIAAARAIRQRLSEQGHLAHLKLYFEPVDRVPDPDNPANSLGLILGDAKLNDPEYIKRLINGIYLQAGDLGLSEHEVVADFTGGPKTLTAGIILACIKPGRRMEYFSQLEVDRIAEEDLKEVWLEYGLQDKL